MWAYVSSPSDFNIVLYEYQPSRAAKNANAFSKGFSGYLHVDGYAGYNQVSNVTLVHCMAHLRRKFYDIYVGLPKDKRDQTKTGRALKYVNDIYALDRKYRGLSIESRYLKKQTKIKPLVLILGTG